MTERLIFAIFGVSVMPMNNILKYWYLVFMLSNNNHMAGTRIGGLGKGEESKLPTRTSKSCSNGW